MFFCSASKETLLPPASSSDKGGRRGGRKNTSFSCSRSKYKTRLLSCSAFCLHKIITAAREGCGACLLCADYVFQHLRPSKVNEKKIYIYIYRTEKNAQLLSSPPPPHPKKKRSIIPLTCRNLRKSIFTKQISASSGLQRMFEEKKNVFTAHSDKFKCDGDHVGRRTLEVLH